MTTEEKLTQLEKDLKTLNETEIAYLKEQLRQLQEVRNVETKVNIELSRIKGEQHQAELQWKKSVEDNMKALSDAVVNIRGASEKLSDRIICSIEDMKKSLKPLTGGDNPDEGAVVRIKRLEEESIHNQNKLQNVTTVITGNEKSSGLLVRVDRVERTLKCYSRFNWILAGAMVAELVGVLTLIFYKVICSGLHLPIGTF